MFQAGILSHPTRVLVLTLRLPPPATSAWSPVIKLQQLRTNTRPGMMSVYRIHLHLRLLSRYSRSWRTRSKFAHPRDTRHVKRFDTPEITRPICDVRFWGLILVDVLLPRVRGLMASRDTQWFTGRELQAFFLVSFPEKLLLRSLTTKKQRKTKNLEIWRKIACPLLINVWEFICSGACCLKVLGVEESQINWGWKSQGRKASSSQTYSEITVIIFIHLNSHLTETLI